MLDEILVLDDSDWDVFNTFYYFGGKIGSDGTEMTPLEKILRPADMIDNTIYNSLAKSDKLSVK